LCGGCCDEPPDEAVEVGEEAVVLIDGEVSPDEASEG
jgi:hypothetical protein